VKGSDGSPTQTCKDKDSPCDTIDTALGKFTDSYGTIYILCPSLTVDPVQLPGTAGITVLDIQTDVLSSYNSQLSSSAVDDTPLFTVCGHVHVLMRCCVEMCIK
jgi:hypothetical protein